MRLNLIVILRGEKWALAYIKSTRSNLLNYLSGSNNFDPLSTSTKDGIPKIIKGLIKYIRSDSYLVIAMILTVLYSTRSLRLGINLDFDSITQPFKGDVTNTSMFMKSFWRELGYAPAVNLPRTLRPDLSAYRSKSGPNGHALMTSLQDVQILPDNLIKSLETMAGPYMG